jgi:hypothetical protein
VPAVRRSTSPVLARPATTARRIQPMVSSVIAAARMSWPMSRRISLRSIRTLAITGTAEMLIATAMNRLNTRRAGVGEVGLGEQLAEGEAGREGDDDAAR